MRDCLRAKAHGMPPGWFERAASRVADVATRVSDKTSAVLDFNSGAADVIVVRCAPAARQACAPPGGVRPRD